jgi:hypothetical protein
MSDRDRKAPAEDLIPAGDAIGLMDDGSINIGPAEVMLPKMLAARREAEAAEAEAAEEDFADLLDPDED